LIAADLLDKIWIVHNSEHCHGDIRPHNIAKRALNDNNRFICDGWKLVNFDKIKKYKTKGPYIGHPGWTAPEMVLDSNKNKYLYSSDIFSFGLVILFCLFGEQPLEITDDDKRRYGQNEDLAFHQNLNGEQRNKNKEKQFKKDLKKKMWTDWYYQKLLSSEVSMKNYLVNLYYDNKISLDLFELLNDGMLVWDASKRWDCPQIYASKWFASIRTIHRRKKLRKLRIQITV